MVDPDPDQAPNDQAEWTAADWRKSTRSPDGPPGCLECAVVGDRVGIRDSHHPAVTLVVGRRAWSDFVAGVKLGEFDN